METSGVRKFSYCWTTEAIVFATLAAIVPQFLPGVRVDLVNPLVTPRAPALSQAFALSCFYNDRNKMTGCDCRVASDELRKGKSFLLHHRQPP
ncbi:hypothetical protein [Nocardia iowensis]|uniref:Uncharacterized protein n=1 Tax=Nocardia iowensis TaxID=204891 RepID=A0ABX8RXE5_NOCIO|nr:hypothetical protein [Nocardia iowensis]QXN93035.1 hypothetical protein KV110_07990 [Nocardia iowensis]